MLKSAEINNLFGLYSYDLIFSKSEKESLQFITGPNGYGKTTLLNFIYSLYNQEFGIFYNIPFDSLIFKFDSATIEIQQQREKVDEDSTDEECEIDTSLVITFYQNSKPEEREISNLGKVYNPEQIEPNLNMYLSSLSCYFIKDQRLSHKRAILKEDIKSNDDASSICAVKDNAVHLTKLLAECKEKLDNTLNVTNLVFNKTISKEEYTNRVDTLLPKLESYREFSLINDNFIPKPYEEQNALFLNAYLNALETAIKDTYDIVNRLIALNNVIDSCELVDKVFQINPRYGFRFVSQNEIRTIIEPENLSSGEQHIIVLAYELLFRTQDFTLVLIDEPEISFHLTWQMKFLENMQSIMKLRKLQCIVATHSPQIFSQNWKLTIDLYKQSKIKNK